MNKKEAIKYIEKYIDRIQKILSTDNLKSKCINKPYRKSLYTEEAGEIIQIQGIVHFLKNEFKIKESELK